MTSLGVFLITAVMLVPALLIAIPVHEMGHALAAYLQGDRSVRYFGYLTLNPRRFLDPLGVIAVFVALVGWGRKAPVQPNRISTTRQKLIHQLGGPAANLLVAILFGLALRGLHAIGIDPVVSLSADLIAVAAYAIAFLNLAIFAFQLLPIPGLDGWDIIETLFRSRNPRFFFNASVRRREIWVGAVLIIFIGQFIGVPVLSIVISPFYVPASLISVGRCIGYQVPQFVYLNPCLVLGG